MATAILSPPLRKVRRRKRERTLERVVIGFALLIPCALGPALIFRNSPGESARDLYEKLIPGLTLQQAQAIMKDEGSDTPPADLTRKYLFTSSEVFLKHTHGRVKTHYWEFPDGLIMARFDSEGIIVARMYLRPRSAHDDIVQRNNPVNSPPSLGNSIAATLPGSETCLRSMNRA